jgi:hypothetical protein
MVKDMNNYQKMRQTNYAIRKYLKKQGFYDIVFFPHTRFFKDIWGLWDFVCKKRLEGSCSMFQIFWGQAKTGYASKEEKERMNDFCLHSGEKGLVVEYAPVKKKHSLKKRKIIITRMGDAE